MFAHRNISFETIAHLERIEDMVRSRYGVPENQIVLVTEEPARLSGGPALMTTILFWVDESVRHKVRVFKPAADVDATDLPATWLRSLLVDDDLEDCC